MYPVHVSSLLHGGGSHMCGVHFHVRGRIHAPGIPPPNCDHLTM